MNTLENKHDIKAGQKWEGKARQTNQDVKNLIARLFAIFAATGGDFDVLIAPLADIVHERNRRLRQLRRKYGFRYRSGEFSDFISGNADPTEHKAMSDLLAFIAFHRLTLALEAAWHAANRDAAFSVKIIDPDFLCACVTIAVGRYLKETSGALVALTLDVMDEERAINFLCGRTSKRISINGPEGTRVRDTLEREYPDEIRRGRLREVLLQELLAEISIKFASIKANPKLDDKLHQLTRLHTTVFSAIEKSIGQPIAVASNTVSISDMIEKDDQKQWELNPEQEFLAKEIVPGFKSLLTPKQYEVLLLSVEGLTATEIADQLGMAAKTVDVHRHDYRERLRKAGADLL